MNIHEHQAKEIFKKFNIKTPNGVVVFSLEDIENKIKLLKTNSLVLKAQIHAGGRGKAGGVKIVKNKKELIAQAKDLFGKKLVTHQTGKEGKEVKRLYIEETCDIAKEFYLSCLIDRSSAKIAFISSNAGGVNIEDVAKITPEKIITTKIKFSKRVNEKDIINILMPFNLSEKLIEKASNLIQSIFQILIEKDASQIEINPLVVTKDQDLLCLDAKISFDDNALYKHADILALKDFNEEDPTETEASKHDLAYIKLDGEIGCMVNGAGLAMATMDIIKLYGAEPANFLDVGGGASKEKVSAAFKIILSDKNVKGILINIFGGIMRCDVLAEGIVEAAKEINISVPLVIRLAGTNVELGKKILSESKLKIISASNLEDAAKKVVEAIK
jgi:succinyl-CoA synthetase beta subunit